MFDLTCLPMFLFDLPGLGILVQYSHNFKLIIDNFYSHIFKKMSIF